MSRPSPFNARTTREAAQWLTETMDGPLNPEQEQALHRWRMADPENERAWLHIHALRQRLSGLDRRAGYQSLSKDQGSSRRSAIKALALLGLFGCAGQLLYRSQSTAGIAYNNGASSPRTLHLDDGSQLTLDAETEVVVYLTAEYRHLQLNSGRLMINSGHAAPYAAAPLSVLTPQGSIRALGTRFLVELLDTSTRVSLFEGSVELQPQNAPLNTLRLKPGERSRLDTWQASANTPDALEPAWSKGLLVAEDMRLDAFARQLARYRPGVLRCSEDVAGLRISGVYPLSDSDAVLHALSHALPIQVQRRSRYWITLSAR
ncbi:fec operon regulator FecR [compost metagenome]|uniref:FecR domain-containing protein n=1 Tax=Pseudomonas TaxID=286 RepID=UPI0003F55ED2|nr:MULTISPECIES: FecR domain-containing protein [Pseudomonas]MCW2272345.1 transmembrane sensor [Pseudomonas sp. JUb96]PRA54908.1 iron dicitrate transport regulator FecR [Pseudomonas sp. MYb187]